MSSQPAPQPHPEPFFDAYVTIRFTVNSDNSGTVRNPEVTGIAAVAVDARSATPIAEFFTEVAPQLSPSCEVPADAPRFTTAVAAMQSWLAGLGLGDAAPLHSYCLVSAGGPDIARLLKHERRAAEQLGEEHVNRHDGVAASALQRWASVFRLYSLVTNKKAKALREVNAALFAKLGDDVVAKLRGARLATGDGMPVESLREAREAATAVCALLIVGARPDFTAEAAPATAEAPHWTTGPLPAATEASATNGIIESLCQLSPAAFKAREPEEAATPATAEPRTETVAAEQGEAARPKAPKGQILAPLAIGSIKRQPAVDILMVDAVRPSMQREEFRAVIRKMCMLLRYEALKSGLDMTADGFVALDALLEHPRMSQVKRATVALVCVENEKNRFSMVYAKNGAVYIRANHSHGIEEIDVNLTPVAIGDAVRFAVHGTNIKHWPSIASQGLSRMARRFVILRRHDAVDAAGERPVLDAAHLSANANHGLRREATCFVCVDVQALLRDGVPVYINANRAVVTPGVDGVIPPAYFAGAIDVDGNDLLARN